MRLTLERDGKRHEVEVDLEGKTVRLNGRTYPFEVVKTGPVKVELEIAGERVLVDGWPKGFAQPYGPVDVNGERAAVPEVQRAEASRSTPSGQRSEVPPPPAERPTAGPVADTGGPGAAIVPPMPGKIIEVRVTEGEAVMKGQVLVVVEAMKMRNEVRSPSNGRAVQVTARAGANVRAKEAMLRVVEG